MGRSQGDISTGRRVAHGRPRQARIARRKSPLASPPDTGRRATRRGRGQIRRRLEASAPGGGDHEAWPRRRQKRREARDQTIRGSPRSGAHRYERRAHSLEDLRGAIAALEADLVRSRGTVRAVVEIDEEVGVYV